MALKALEEKVKKFMTDVETNPKKAVQSLLSKLSSKRLGEVKDELGQKSANLQKKIGALASLVWGDEMDVLDELQTSIKSAEDTACKALLYAVMSAKMDTGDLKTMVEVIEGHADAMDL